MRFDADREVDRDADGWAAIVAAAPIGVGVFDTDARFVYVNPRLCEINERPREEHLGRRLGEVIDHPGAAGVEAIVRSVLVTGVPQVDEDLANRLDRPLDAARYYVGSYYPLRERGEIVAVVALVWDASAARQAEIERIANALQRSEDRHRFIVAATSSIVWCTDLEARIVEEMPSWTAFTGQAPAAYAGHGWMDAVHPDDRPALERARRIAHVGADSYEARYRVWSAAHDEYRHVVARGALRRSADGAPIEWVGVCIDEHDHVLAQQALKRRREATTALAALGRALSSTTDALDALQRTAEALVEMTSATSVRIDLVGRNRPAVRGDAHRADVDSARLDSFRELHDEFAELVDSDPRPRWCRGRHGVESELRAELRPTVARAHVAAVAAVPVAPEARSAPGSLTIIWDDRDAQADHEPLDQVLIDSIDTTLQLLREALERLRLNEEEHRFTSEFQRALVQPLRLPERVEGAARYVPAARQMTMGGDWYDAVTLSDGRVALVVGDVTGHGPAAAAEMAQLRGAMSTLLSLDLSPSDTMLSASSLCAQHDPPMMASALVVELDPTRSRCRHLSAGHTPFIVVPRGQPAAILERPRRPVLGLPASRSADDGELTLPEGSLVLMFTDGLIERRDRPVDAGLQAILEIVERLRDLPCEELVDRVVLECRPALEDDLVVIAVRITG